MGCILLPYICWKRIFCPFKRARDITFLVINDKVMYGLLTRSSDRPSKARSRSLSIPAPGDRCPMVGMKLISKPVEGLHSTAIYLLKEDNLPIQTSKRYHVYGEKWQSYVWSIDKVERPSNRVRHAIAHCQSPRRGGGCPMVGMK